MKKTLKFISHYMSEEGLQSPVYFGKDAPVLVYANGESVEATFLRRCFEKVDSEEAMRHAIAKAHKEFLGKRVADVVAIVPRGEEGMQLAVLTAGNLVGYTYRREGLSGDPTVEVSHLPTLRLGAEGGEVELVETMIDAEQICDEFSSQSTLICEERISQALGDEAIRQLMLEYGKGAFICLYRALQKAAAEAGVEDGKVICFGAYVLVDRSDEPERCWKTDCERWDTCDGYGCPSGNWHDI